MKSNIISGILATVTISCIILLVIMKFSLDTALVKIETLEDKVASLSFTNNVYTETSIDKPPAPNFELLNKEGAIISLNDFSNEKRKILVFGSKDCNYCKEYYPELHNFSKEYTNLDVIVIEEGSTVEDLKKHSKESQYSFVQLVGTLKVINDYQVESTPTTYLLDEKNNIVRVGIINTKLDLESFVFKV